MKMNEKQTAQVRRFLQWCHRSTPTQAELEAAMQRLDKRTGLDVSRTVIKMYVDKVIKEIQK